MPIISRCTDLGAPCARCKAPDTSWIMLDRGALVAVCPKCAAELATPAEVEQLKEMDKIMRRIVKRGEHRAQPA